jgi:PAS domain S-box-containing protein
LHNQTASSDALSRRFDLLAAGATDHALFLTDPDGRLNSWNLGAERLFGYQADEAVGRHFSRFFSSEDLITDQPAQELQTAATNGHADGIRWQVRKDGSRFWCKTTLTALFNEVKQIHAFARVMHDLTVDQASEAESKRADGLAEANRGKEEFLALLSHELRNPLSPILNALGILRQLRTDDPVIQQAGGIIERQVKQMVRLVDDLLDISRITQGKLRLTTERVDLRVVMNRAADSARPLLTARRHEFSLLLPTEPLWVEADPGRLEQVSVNLLSNAAKYSDIGGLIRMSVAREDDDAVVRVLDNGIGIAPEMLSKVFDLFTQVDGSLTRSHGGLGIGLALVHTLVEMQHGRVKATSDGLGKGSEFTVKLPLSRISKRTVSSRPWNPASGRASLIASWWSKTTSMRGIASACFCVSTGTRCWSREPAQPRWKQPRRSAPHSCCWTSGCREWMATKSPDGCGPTPRSPG